jgi:outer membrane lipoprotein-sorting protein
MRPRRTTRRRIPNLTTVLLLACLAGLAGSPPAPAEDRFSECLERADRTFRALQSYQCLYEAFSSDGKRSESFLYEYAFRKPKIIRMKVLRGRNRGTILLYDQSRGKVRVRVGSGLLASLRVSLSPSSPKLVDLQGHGIDHSDWGWFIGQHRAQRGLFDSRELGREDVDGRPARVFELISKDTLCTRGIGREKVWFDSGRGLFVRYEVFSDRDALIQSGTFSRIVLDPALDPSFFSEFRPE